MNKIVINGNGNKSILIITGVHGDELTPINVGLILSKSNILNESKEKFKKITILNCLNKESIKKNKRELIIDINRSFSNKNEEDIIQLTKYEILSHDVILDIHSSPSCNEFVLLNLNETSYSYIDFCNKYNISYLIREFGSNTIKKYCLDLDKIAFTIELNGMNKIDYNSTSKGIILVLDIINNIDNFKIIENKEVLLMQEILSPSNGIVIMDYKPGDFIKNKDIIGNVYDLDTFEQTPIIFEGDIESQIITSSDGVYITDKDCICLIQPKNN